MEIKSFITENYELRCENNKLRMEIIKNIMNIYDTKQLKHLLTLSNHILDKEVAFHPDTITDIANMMDLPDLIRMMDVVEKMDQNLIATKQMKAAFIEMIKIYTGEK